MVRFARVLWVGVALAVGPWGEASADVHTPFIRGDANASGSVDLTDAVGILGYLFLGEAEPSCLQTADTNADSAIDLADPVSVLSFLFLGGTTIAEPFPGCGRDWSSDGRLGCASYPPCAVSGLQIVDEAVIQVTPQMFTALQLLAPGESVQALSGVVGFADYLAQRGSVGGGAAATLAPYSPTINIRTNTDYLDLTAENVLDAVSTKLVEAGLQRLGSRVTAIYPPAAWQTDGNVDVLVYAADATGHGWLRGGRVVWNAEDPVAVDVTPPAACSGNLDCKWIVSLDAQPSEPHVKGSEKIWSAAGTVTHADDDHFHNAIFRDKDGGADGQWVKNGFGPWHEIFVTRRGTNNCTGPDTNRDAQAHGFVQVNIGLDCTDDGKKCDPPAGCDATVHVAATYTSRVKTQAQTGGACPDKTSEIDIEAKDEAAFMVNGHPIFNKSLWVENMTFDHLQIPDFGQGSAADPDQTNGQERMTALGNGEKQGDLVGVGADTLDPPVEAVLISDGLVRFLKAAGKAWGYGHVTTAVYCIYYDAYSDCPGAGHVSGGQVWGDKPSMDAQEKTVTADLERRNKDKNVVWTPMGPQD